MIVGRIVTIDPFTGEAQEKAAIYPLITVKRLSPRSKTRSAVPVDSMAIIATDPDRPNPVLSSLPYTFEAAAP